MAREPGARSAGYGDPDRKGGGILKWLLPLLGVLLLALLLLALLRGCGADKDKGATTTPRSTTTQASGSSSGGSGAGSGTLTAAGQAVPLSGSLQRFAGKSVQGRSVQVESVVGDEAFWVGESKAKRVLVHLARGTESPFKVRDNQRLTLSGKVTPLKQGDEQRFGVKEAEGTDQLSAQGHYIEATRLEDQ